VRLAEQGCRMIYVRHASWRCDGTCQAVHGGRSGSTKYSWAMLQMSASETNIGYLQVCFPIVRNQPAPLPSTRYGGILQVQWIN
jgi:hypothetical protein